MDKIFTVIRGWRIGDLAFLVAEHADKKVVFECSGDAVVESEITDLTPPSGAQEMTAAALAPYTKKVAFVGREHKNFKRLLPAATLFVAPPVRTRAVNSVMQTQAPVLQPVANVQTPPTRIRAPYVPASNS